VAISGRLLRFFPIVKSLSVLNAIEPVLLFCSAPDSLREFFHFMKFAPPSPLAGIALVMNPTTIPKPPFAQVPASSVDLYIEMLSAQPTPSPLPREDKKCQIH
jgi:hypothetical protein